MVATDYHDLQLWELLFGCGKKIIILGLGLGGWIGGIKNVATNDKIINPLLAYGFQKPGKKAIMLILSGITMQAVAEVPIGCVKKSHIFVSISKGIEQCFLLCQNSNHLARRSPPFPLTEKTGPLY